MFKSTLSLLAFALTTLSTQAFAANTSGNFQANATVSSSCIVSATNVIFGNITPAASGTLDANGSITSTCSNGVSYSVRITAGSSNDHLHRTMSGSSGNTDTLAYNLYTSASHDTVWANPATSVAVELVGKGVAETTVVYGSLDLNQYLKPDNYSDSLTVNLLY